ncbi:CmpA/NrtA family ABC transporter substrate-binding protein [Halomonas binhaiensis]|uniref:ABC transporter substrate-binding protein n=1 Tax=Halomonas binhaiensis TaxID=2562282 RepID=A0A5C1NH13_9GAMM|nr:CmpA/NrtA family ABC transporter substrate-binding protein [Halomonas binhaiensis]QEM82504.1 ABC transporter substrate-binding protein [Halomonas binhaiensis]
MSEANTFIATPRPPEIDTLTLGFIPLIDAALLIIAREGGHFAAQGLDVNLSRENAWSTLRDKVAAGFLDGAHMLAPMPLAMSLGMSRAPCETLAPIVLGTHGNTLVLSNRYAEGMAPPDPNDPARNARALRDLLSDRLIHHRGTPPRLAMVYPYSWQHLQIRAWLERGGVDPDSDVELIALPPARMVDALHEGQIDGFCVGEPWGSLAEHHGIGRIVANGADLFPGHPEKVLGVTASWARRYPETLSALLRAIQAAADWLDSGEDAQQQTLQWLALPPYLDRHVSHLDKLPLGQAPTMQYLTRLSPHPEAFAVMAAHMRPLAESRGNRLDPEVLARCYRPLL